MATDVSSGPVRVTATYSPMQLAVPVEAHVLGAPFQLHAEHVGLTGRYERIHRLERRQRQPRRVARWPAPRSHDVGATTSGCSSLSSSGLISSLVTAVTTSVQNDLAAALEPSLTPVLQSELAGLSPSGAIAGAGSGVSLAAPITSTALSGAGLSVTNSVSYTADRRRAAPPHRPTRSLSVRSQRPHLMAPATGRAR